MKAVHSVDRTATSMAGHWAVRSVAMMDPMWVAPTVVSLAASKAISRAEMTAILKVVMWVDMRAFERAELTEGLRAVDLAAQTGCLKAA